MQNSYIVKFHNSFAAKVCVWMLATSVSIFAVCFGVSLWSASDAMLSNGHQKANLELDKAILYVVDEMNNVETSARNLLYLGRRDRLLAPDELYAAFHNFLAANPKVKGVAVGFERGLYPQYKNGFVPFVSRGRDGKLSNSNIANSYNYYNREWYRQTKLMRKARWSNSFVDVNGDVVCSYCIPLVSKEGVFYGVLAVDLSLAELSDRVQGIKPYPKSYLTIMDRNLNFLVHPNHRLILKGNPMQVLDRRRYEVNETIFVDIRNQKRGIGAFGIDGANKFLYYAPIKRSGWTVTLECDRNEIIADVADIRWHMILISLLGLLGLGFVCTVVMRRLLRPIHLYSDAALSIAEGNFNTPLPHMSSHDELWALGNSLNDMQHSLDRYINELKATTQEKGRIESELSIASKIQMSMIPKIFPPYPDRDDIDIFGSITPAKAVGGDLYDFFLRDEKLFFCVGDVSGKGVPASLVMAVTRSLLRIVAAQESHPERIVASINNSMSDMNESNMFVTLFVGVLDLPTGRFRYCNAGHNAPVIVDGDTGEVHLLNVKPNLPVAIMPDMKFEMQETVVKRGMTIFMYTDGLTEAENDGKELFGEERMLAELKGTSRKTSKEQVENMLNAVHKHVDGAEQSDDLTMIAIKYKRRHRETKYYCKLTLYNDVSNVPKIADFMDDIVGETGIDAAMASSLNLAIEEAVVNVMNYAYPKGQCGEILLEAYANDDRLKFVITDSGVPFDPTVAAEPDVSADLDDRPIGGLGIFLVRNIMDSVNYERVSGENVLTLRKMLGGGK